QDRVALVPEREREAEALMVVRDAEDAVLAPAMHAGARVIVGERLPRLAVRGVVLAHRAPLSVGQVSPPPPPLRLLLPPRPPPPPVSLLLARVPQPLSFRVHRLFSLSVLVGVTEAPRQHLAQRHARAVQARLDRRGGFAEDLRHLLVRQLLDVAEHEESAVV